MSNETVSAMLRAMSVTSAKASCNPKKRAYFPIADDPGINQLLDPSASFVSNQPPLLVNRQWKLPAINRGPGSQSCGNHPVCLLPRDLHNSGAITVTREFTENGERHRCRGVNRQQLVWASLRFFMAIWNWLLHTRVEAINEGGRKCHRGPRDK